VRVGCPQSCKHNHQSYQINQWKRNYSNYFESFARLDKSTDGNEKHQISTEMYQSNSINWNMESSMFGNATDWKCPAHLVKNPESATKCLACKTILDVVVQPQKRQRKGKENKQGFTQEPTAKKMSSTATSNQPSFLFRNSGGNSTGASSISANK